MSILRGDVYGFIRRGLTQRNLVPWGVQTEGGVKIANIVPRNDVTIAGSKLVSDKQGRSYFDFQNQSDTDMRVNFGIAASASIGYLIPAGGSRIWDAQSNVGVVSDQVHVFCAVADKAYAYAEAGQ